MRLKRYFLRTYKEAPKDAQIPSHILMHRAEMIQKITSGIYNYLPLSMKVLKKIEEIIREELDKRGCQEVLISVVQPSDLWEECGRWNSSVSRTVKMQTTASALRMKGLLPIW